MKKVFWIIGLPNSGKTAIAQALQLKLRQRGEMAVLLDGDQIRSVLAMENSHYDLAARQQNALRIGRLAQMIYSQDIDVIVAANTLFHQVQNQLRQTLPGYFEIFLKCSEDVRRARDGVKGLYSRFDEGLVSQVLGLDLPAEEPINPEFIIENDGQLMPHEIAQMILDQAMA